MYKFLFCLFYKDVWITHSKICSLVELNRSVLHLTTNQSNILRLGNQYCLRERFNHHLSNVMMTAQKQDYYSSQT